MPSNGHIMSINTYNVFTVTTFEFITHAVFNSRHVRNNNADSEFMITY
jgi:hypothetical protein